MTALYHGLSPRDAVLWVYARHGALLAEGTIRAWLSQGKIQRTKDGQIDPFILDDWWQYQAGRVQERGKDGRYGRVALTTHPTDATLTAVPHTPTQV